jgi:hypothetical protein
MPIETRAAVSMTHHAPTANRSDDPLTQLHIDQTDNLREFGFGDEKPEFKIARYGWLFAGINTDSANYIIRFLRQLETPETIEKAELLLDRLREYKYQLILNLSQCGCGRSQSSAVKCELEQAIDRIEGRISESPFANSAQNGSDIVSSRVGLEKQSELSPSPETSRLSTIASPVKAPKAEPMRATTKMGIFDNKESVPNPKSDPKWGERDWSDILQKFDILTVNLSMLQEHVALRIKLDRLETLNGIAQQKEDDLESAIRQRRLTNAEQAAKVAELKENLNQIREIPSSAPRHDRTSMKHLGPGK